MTTKELRARLEYVARQIERLNVLEAEQLAQFIDGAAWAYLCIKDGPRDPIIDPSGKASEP